MAAGMRAGLSADWMADYIIRSTERNPEVTEWDDEETMRDKLKRRAEARSRSRR